MLTRRRLLSAAGSLAAAGYWLNRPGVLDAAPQAATEFGRVKIADVKTASLRIRYPAHLVKVVTDSGVYGIGEAYNRAGIVNHIEAIKSRVIGEDPLQVDYLYIRKCARQVWDRDREPDRSPVRSPESRRRSGMWREESSTCPLTYSWAASSATRSSSITTPDHPTRWTRNLG